MASVKLATLVIRTAAKPISNSLKAQAKQHDRFREICVSIAQMMHRTEVNMRTQLMGEPAKHIRPLSEARAIESGANALAEGFLFSVAAALIIGETWRSSRSQSKRQGDVNDQLDTLGTKVIELTTRVDDLAGKWENDLREEKHRNDELARILERVVEIGLRGGWTELQDTPLHVPGIELAPRLSPQPGSPSRLSSGLPQRNDQIDIDTPKSSSDSSPPPNSSQTS